MIDPVWAAIELLYSFIHILCSKLKINVHIEIQYNLKLILRDCEYNQHRHHIFKIKPTLMRFSMRQALQADLLLRYLRCRGERARSWTQLTCMAATTWWWWCGGGDVMVAMCTNRPSCLRATSCESICSSKSLLRTGFLLAVCQPFFFQFGIHAVSDFIYRHKDTPCNWKGSTLPTSFTYQPNIRCHYSRRSFARTWPWKSASKVTDGGPSTWWRWCGGANAWYYGDG